MIMSNDQIRELLSFVYTLMPYCYPGRIAIGQLIRRSGRDIILVQSLNTKGMLIMLAPIIGIKYM